MRGEEYLGYSRGRDGKIFHNTMRESKSMGPTCISEKCVKYKNRFCDTILQEQREIIFQKFWKDLDWDQKKIYVTSLMHKKPVSRRYVSGDSKRSFTYEYFLKVNEDTKQVCKQMFLSTLGLKEWVIHQWCSTAVHGMHSSREVMNNIKQKDNSQDEQKEFLKLFLNNLPKMPAHYCRKDTKKLYLEADFGSKSNLYRVYKNHCEENGKVALSSFVFSEIFEEMNLALFCPKKDQCNTCVSHKAGNVDQKVYDEHIKLKNRARSEKDFDKKDAETQKKHVFVMDVQAVKLCPVNDANKFYFKTRLKVHNFTIYNLGTHQCTNYWWNESEGDLVASVFTSIIIHHIEKHCVDGKPIILWSDGCPYQNRNSILANALCNYSNKNNISITQKYLEPGHSQMECDSVHSVIERKLNHREISLPFEYVNITKNARQKPFPYDAEYLEHQFFKNYDDSNILRYKSIRPGRTTNDPTVTNIRVLNYEADGKIRFKLNFEDDLAVMPQRSKEIDLNYSPKRLYQNRRKISNVKYVHLQDMKTTLTKETQHYYDNLPYE
nr:unnamed protein product [Callosobruchus chinensis]